MQWQGLCNQGNFFETARLSGQHEKSFEVGFVHPHRCSLYLTGVASTFDSSFINGFTEKNLCRHGPHRSAGTRSTRHNIAVIPGTCSAAIRCKSKLPQIPQCA